MPSEIALRVVVDEPLRQRLRALAAADNRSVSSYIRVLINRHLVALDRAEAQQPPAVDLQSFYESL